MATAPVRDMLIKPYFFKLVDILSISLLSAVTCNTQDLFVSSNITGLNFLQALITILISYCLSQI